MVLLPVVCLTGMPLAIAANRSAVIRPAAASAKILVVFMCDSSSELSEHMKPQHNQERMSLPLHLKCCDLRLIAAEMRGTAMRRDCCTPLASRASPAAAGLGGAHCGAAERWLKPQMYAATADT